jgi:hypothetical protein
MKSNLTLSKLVAITSLQIIGTTGLTAFGQIATYDYAKTTKEDTLKFTPFPAPTQEWKSNATTEKSQYTYNGPTGNIFVEVLSPTKQTQNTRQLIDNLDLEVKQTNPKYTKIGEVEENGVFTLTYINAKKTTFYKLTISTKNQTVFQSNHVITGNTEEDTTGLITKWESEIKPQIIGVETENTNENLPNLDNPAEVKKAIAKWKNKQTPINTAKTEVKKDDGNTNTNNNPVQKDTTEELVNKKVLNYITELDSKKEIVENKPLIKTEKINANEYVNTLEENKTTETQPKETLKLTKHITIVEPEAPSSPSLWSKLMFWKTTNKEIVKTQPKTIKPEKITADETPKVPTQQTNIITTATTLKPTKTPVSVQIPETTKTKVPTTETIALTSNKSKPIEKEETTQLDNQATVLVVNPPLKQKVIEVKTETPTPVFTSVLYNPTPKITEEPTVSTQTTQPEIKQEIPKENKTKTLTSIDLNQTFYAEANGIIWELEGPFGTPKKSHHTFLNRNFYKFTPIGRKLIDGSPAIVYLREKLNLD